MCPVSKFDKKIPKGNVPNWRLQICNRYGNRWSKCQLKPPKSEMCPPQKNFFKKKKKIFFFFAYSSWRPPCGRPSWNFGRISEIQGSISQPLEPLQSKSLYIQNLWASAILMHPTCPLWTSIGQVKFFTCWPLPCG